MVEKEKRFIHVVLVSLVVAVALIAIWGIVLTRNQAEIGRGVLALLHMKETELLREIAVMSPELFSEDAIRVVDCPSDIEERLEDDPGSVSQECQNIHRMQSSLFVIQGQATFADIRTLIWRTKEKPDDATNEDMYALCIAAKLDVCEERWGGNQE